MLGEIGEFLEVTADEVHFEDLGPWIFREPTTLELHGLQQVEILPDLSNLKKPRSLLVQCCGNLVEIQLKLPQSLEA